MIDGVNSKGVCFGWKNVDLDFFERIYDELNVGFDEILEYISEKKRKIEHD